MQRGMTHEKETQLYEGMGMCEPSGMFSLIYFLIVIA